MEQRRHRLPMNGARLAQPQQRSNTIGSLDLSEGLGPAALRLLAPCLPFWGSDYGYFVRRHLFCLLCEYVYKCGMTTSPELWWQGQRL